MSMTSEGVRPKRSAKRLNEGLALAQATWEAAKAAGMHHHDLLTCCAVVLANVADKTGESLDCLLSEVARLSHGVVAAGNSALESQATEGGRE